MGGVVVVSGFDEAVIVMQTLPVPTAMLCVYGFLMKLAKEPRNIKVKLSQALRQRCFVLRVPSCQLARLVVAWWWRLKEMVVGGGGLLRLCCWRGWLVLKCLCLHLCRPLLGSCL